KCTWWAHVALPATRPIYSISWIKFYAGADSISREFNPTYTVVSPGYFAASGVRLLAEGDCDDTRAGQHAVILSETSAKGAWPAGRAIGEQMYFGTRGGD